MPCAGKKIKPEGSTLSRGGTGKRQPMSWELNVNGFVASVTGQLAGANGYSMELRQRGKTVVSSSAGDAINGPLESAASHPVATVP